MTTDQLLYLVGALAWPTVALIAAFAFLRGMSILEGIADSFIRCVNIHIAKTLKRALLVEERQSRTALAVARISSPGPVANTGLPETCERALLAILANQGVFPWGPKDDGARQLVRELRKMYDELANPTPEPARTGLSADDLTLDELADDDTGDRNVDEGGNGSDELDYGDLQ